MQAGVGEQLQSPDHRPCSNYPYPTRLLTVSHRHRSVSHRLAGPTGQGRRHAGKSLLARPSSNDHPCQQANAPCHHRSVSGQLPRACCPERCHADVHASRRPALAVTAARRGSQYSLAARRRNRWHRWALEHIPASLSMGSRNPTFIYRRWFEGAQCNKAHRRGLGRTPHIYQRDPDLMGARNVTQQSALLGQQ